MFIQQCCLNKIWFENHCKKQTKLFKINQRARDLLIIKNIFNSVEKY